VAFHVLHVLEVTRIGEIIEIHKRMFGIFRNDMTYEVRADKSRPSGNEYLHQSNLKKDVGSFSYLTPSIWS
jgi:hypothetical protein